MIVRKMCAAQADAYTEKHFSEFTSWRQLRIRLMLMRGRERTGIKDQNGLPIFSGDILKTSYNEHYPVVTELVVWDEEFAAFTTWLEFESGGGASSQNMSGTNKATIIGNIYKNPELLVRAKRAK